VRRAASRGCLAERRVLRNESSRSTASAIYSSGEARVREREREKERERFARVRRGIMRGCLIVPLLMLARFRVSFSPVALLGSASPVSRD